MCRPHTRFLHSGQQPQLVGGRKGKGRALGEGKEHSLLQTSEGRNQAGRAPRWRSTPSLIPVLTGLLGDSPRQVGHRPWLERRCPEKQPVPGGSRDMCSTVHGSYQLSTDPPTLPCDFQPPSAVPAALMRTTGVAQPDPTLPHGHLVLVGPYAPTPITPKGKQDNKNQTPLKYPHPTRNFGPNE